MSSGIIKLLSLLYLTLPLFIWIIAFLRTLIAVPFIIIMILALYQYYNDECAHSLALRTIVGKISNISLLLFAFFICFFVGIGAYWPEMPDFLMKNAIVNDLSTKSWPVYYDLSVQPLQTQEDIGRDRVLFVYYLFYYLPACLLGKLFGTSIAQISLLIWSILGVYITFLLIILNLKVEFLNKKHILVLIVAVASFGGLCFVGDIVLNYEKNLGHFLFGTMEMWANQEDYFWLGYQGFLGGMSWAFNQYIPIWIITSLILLRNSDKNLMFIGALSVLYSPWSTFGFVALITMIVINKIISTKGLYEIMSFSNIVVPIMLLFTVCVYYMTNNGTNLEKGFIWQYFSCKEAFLKLLFFLIIEIGVYIVLLYKEILKNQILLYAVIILTLLPFFKLNYSNDTLMRASAPAMFIIFVFWFEKLVKGGIRRPIVIVVMMITSVAQLQLFAAKFVNVIFRNKFDVLTQIRTFDHIEEPLPYYSAELCDRQFFAHDYDNSIFYKYLIKK